MREVIHEIDVREEQIAVERGGSAFTWAQRADGKISLIGYPWLGDPPAH